MLVLKKNDPNIAVTPDANRATLYISNDEYEILSIKQANGYTQLLTFHDSNFTGNMTMTGNITLNSGQVIINGNLTASNIQGPLANGTSNVRIATLNGNVVTTVAGNSTLTVSATGANVAGTANVTGNTAIGGNANITGNLGVATNANITANLTAGNGNVTGELLVGGNANITTDLRVAGNALIVGNITVQGNTTYINVENLNVEDPIINLGGGANGAPLTSNDGKDRGTALQYYTTAPVTAFMGWDNSNAEFTMSSNATITNDIATYNELGNLRALNLIGNIARGTSNVAIPSLGGNVNISVGAIANVLVVTSTGANVTGTANVTGNVALGAFLSVVSNVAAANFVGPVANGTSNLSIPVLNGNVSVTAGGNTVLTVSSTGANIVGTGNISGNVAMGANLTVTSNVTAANFIGNIVTGVVSNGTSNLTIPAANGNVNISSAGNANILVVTGTGANVAGTANITGNTAIGANLTVTSNVTAANFQGVLANGNSTVSIPAAAGNVNISSAGNANILVITGTGANIAGTVNATGNANVGNLGTAGLITATGNVTGGNIIATGGILATESATGNLFTSANTATLNVGLGANTLTLGSTTSNSNVRGNLNVVGFVTGNTAYYGNGTGGNFAIGYRDVPQIVANANITLGFTDAGKHFYANATPAFNITIPTHANAALPIGTAVSIVQAGANSVTIVPQSGVTLRFAGNPAATGNRTVSTSGVAALIKVENNIWYISGSGVA